MDRELRAECSSDSSLMNLSSLIADVIPLLISLSQNIKI
jgi:hypothetical protein